MVKLITILACTFFMYRLIFPAKRISSVKEDKAEAKVIDIDYEEIE